MKDCYRILGVPPDASAGHIRSACRSAARSLHPDLGHGPEGSDRLLEVGEAYDVLADRERRRSYDTRLVRERGRLPLRLPGAADVVVHVPAGIRNAGRLRILLGAEAFPYAAVTVTLYVASGV